MTGRNGGLKQAARRKGSFARTARAIAWAFFGVRNSGEYDKDVSQLNPVHVIIGGVIGALLFVAALVVIAKWVVASGVAA